MIRIYLFIILYFENIYCKKLNLNKSVLYLLMLDGLYCIIIIKYVL